MGHGLLFVSSFQILAAKNEPRLGRFSELVGIVNAAADHRA